MVNKNYIAHCIQHIHIKGSCPYEYLITKKNPRPFGWRANMFLLINLFVITISNT